MPAVAVPAVAVPAVATAVANAVPMLVWGVIPVVVVVVILDQLLRVYGVVYLHDESPIVLLLHPLLFQKATTDMFELAKVVFLV